MEFGIRGVNADQPKLVTEGYNLTFTVGFLEDTVQLDDDFVLGYSIKIHSTGPGTMSMSMY